MVVCIIVIVSISFILFYYLHKKTENNIQTSLFEQQKQLQIFVTKAVAQHIGSDLDLVMARLQGLANLKLIQDRKLWSSSMTMASLDDSFFEMNTITLKNLI